MHLIVINKAKADKTRKSLAIQTVQTYGDWITAYLKGIAWAKSIKIHEELKQQVEQWLQFGISTGSDFSPTKG